MATNGNEKSSHDSDKTDGDNSKQIRRSILDVNTSHRDRLNSVFENPLANVPDEQLMHDVEEFCEKHGMMEHLDDMKKGALISKAPDDVQDASYLDDSEKEVIIREKTHKWDHPLMLYWLCGMLVNSVKKIDTLIYDTFPGMCSLAAATQGMDETANNGALPIYPEVCVPKTNANLVHQCS